MFPIGSHASDGGRAGRDRILFDLCMVLRKVPRGILRDLAKRRLPIGGMAEKIVAEAIVEHLQLCGWRLGAGAQGQAYDDAGAMIPGCGPSCSSSPIR